jgi:hypothetical protein
LVNLLANEPLDVWRERVADQKAFIELARNVQNAHGVFQTAAASLDIALGSIIRRHLANQGTHSVNDRHALQFVLGRCRGFSQDQILPYLNAVQAPAWVERCNQLVSTDQDLQPFIEAYLSATKLISDTIRDLKSFLELPLLPNSQQAWLPWLVTLGRLFRRRARGPDGAGGKGGRVDTSTPMHSQRGGPPPGGPPLAGIE